MVDFYELLKVSQNATVAEIQSAFERLRPYCEGPKLQVLKEAYQTLNNPESRKKYDNFLRNMAYHRKRDYHSLTSKAVKPVKPLPTKHSVVPFLRKLDDGFSQNKRLFTVYPYRILFGAIAAVLLAAHIRNTYRGPYRITSVFFEQMRFNTPPTCNETSQVRRSMKLKGTKFDTEFMQLRLLKLDKNIEEIYAAYHAPRS